MVARQMRAGGRLSEEELWTSIESAIDRATSAALERARVEGVDVRTAYLREHGASKN